MSPVKVIASVALAAILAGTASAAFAGAALTTSMTRLYEGPVAGAGVVATVAPGARVGVLWCGMHGEWCLVTYHAKQGFVAPTALKLIGGQLAVGTVSSQGGNGGGSGVTSGPTGLHMALGAGTLSLGSMSGGSQPGGTPALAMATTRPH